LPILCQREISTWPVGQAVKTPPFHGGNTGSSPVRVTFHFNISTWSRGVAVNMPACHAGDRGFNSRRDRPESLQHTKSWGFFVVPSWIKIVKSDTFIMDNYEKRASEAK